MKPKKPAPKMSGLVVAALRNLRDAHGSTAREIMKYIMAEYNASEKTVQRQLKTALKRGVEYGILKKTNTGYSLNTDAEVIGPIDLEQMDSMCCPKKRKKRTCPCPRKKKKRCHKKKRKRASCHKPKRRCGKKKRKRNPCNVCSARGRKGNCSDPVQLVHEGSPGVTEDPRKISGEVDKRSLDDDENGDETLALSRSRSTSRSKGQDAGNRSRSQSMNRSRYSCSENDDERIDED